MRIPPSGGPEGLAEALEGDYGAVESISEGEFEVEVTSDRGDEPGRFPRKRSVCRSCSPGCNAGRGQKLTSK